MQTQLPEVIERIYDAAVDPLLWPSVMRSIASLVNSEMARVALVDRSGHWIESIALHPDYPVDAIAEYNAHWAHRDPFREKAERLTSDTLRDEGELAPPAGASEAEIYNDYYIKWGWGRGLGGYVMRNNNELASFGLYRSIDDPPYTRQELEVANTLARHVGRAVEVNRRVKRADLGREIWEETLNAIDSAVVVLDPVGRVLLTNTRADTILAARDGLSIEAGKLDAHFADERRALRKAISLALAAGQQRTASACTIGRADGGPLRLIVSPFGRRGLAAGVLVIITNPDEELGELALRFAERHGLTPTEARVASALCRGLSPAAIAASTNTSVHTVRSHLKHIQSKVGVRGQSRIVAELLQGPGFVTPADC